ncbi:MAG: DUF5320 domain-containing protein [Nitrospirota bacterium]
MPRGDGTGPRGMGPMSGRAAGFCAGFGMPGYANSGLGRGFGMGFGQGLGGRIGRGRRNMFYATGQPRWMRFSGYASAYQNADAEMQKQTLKTQAEVLQSELDIIKKRLSEIDAEADVK